MKAKLLLLLFCLCAVGAMGQEPLCRKCRKAVSKCVCNKEQQAPKPKPKPTPKPQPTPQETKKPHKTKKTQETKKNKVSREPHQSTPNHNNPKPRHIKRTSDIPEKNSEPLVPQPTPKPTPQPTPRKQTASYSNHVLRVDNVVYNMKRVEGGTFTMGATAEMSEPSIDEKPTHQVTLSSYAIGETEVTQALWQAVMGNNPSYFKGDDLPVENVGWDECQTFINKLNNLTGQRFRLPTEAEWEFAARGGNRSHHTKYSGSSSLDEVAWYEDNSGSKTHPVKTKRANELGIYDMAGNVWEWCQDWYGIYSSSSQSNPTGPGSGSDRVSRGGSWSFTARYCCSSYRNGSTPDYRSSGLGLRLALSE